MSAEQNEAEHLDDDKLGQPYPPEEPVGVDAYGTTAAEERYDEPLAERVTREQADFGEPAEEDFQLVEDADRPIDGQEAASTADPELDLADRAAAREADPADVADSRAVEVSPEEEAMRIEGDGDPRQ